MLAVDFNHLAYEAPASGDGKFIIPQKLQRTLGPSFKELHAITELVLTSNLPFSIFLLVWKMVSFQQAEHFMINFSKAMFPSVIFQDTKP